MAPVETMEKTQTESSFVTTRPVQPKPLGDSLLARIGNTPLLPLHRIACAEGISPKEVGRRLFISPKTVENHRSSIMHKLGLHSTMELVRYAARFGLIDVNHWKK